MPTNYGDVKAFHLKYGVPAPEKPALLSAEDFAFRFKFLREELTEFKDAQDAGDLAKAADALIDLVYVALGTAIWMGLPWQLLWDEVQAVNMTKVAATSVMESARETGRGHAKDIVKPPGFRPPRIQELLDAYQLFLDNKDPSAIQRLQRTRLGIYAGVESHKTMDETIRPAEASGSSIRIDDSFQKQMNKLIQGTTEP